MNIRITIAQTDGERRSLYRVRHRVFVEEERSHRPTANGLLSDRFDEPGASVNFVAEVDGTVAGGMRLVFGTEFGDPLEEFGFDFSTRVPDLDRGCVRLTSVCLLEEYRHVPYLAYRLLAAPVSAALARRAQYIIGHGNPATFPLFRRVGFRTLAAEQKCEANSLRYIPAAGDAHQVAARLERLLHGRTHDRGPVGTGRIGGKGAIMRPSSSGSGSQLGD